MAGAGYTYIWEYEVRPGASGEFLRHYGPDGSWARLFRVAPGYLDTVLLRDLDRPDRYVTIDRWESEAAFRAFRELHASEFEALDARCAALTISEKEIGRFAGSA